MVPKGPCSSVSQGLVFLFSCQKLYVIKEMKVIKEKKVTPTHL